MKKKSKVLISISVICILILGIVIYYSFYKIDYRPFKASFGAAFRQSPNEEYALSVSFNMAAMDAEIAYITCGISKRGIENGTVMYGIHRIIYYQKVFTKDYPDYRIEAYWIDDDTIMINGVKLNIHRNYYDYRRKLTWLIAKI